MDASARARTTRRPAIRVGARARRGRRPLLQGRGRRRFEGDRDRRRPLVRRPEQAA